MVGRTGPKKCMAKKVTVACGIAGKVWYLEATQNGFNWYSGNSMQSKLLFILSGLCRILDVLLVENSFWEVRVGWLPNSFLRFSADLRKDCG